MTLEEERKLLDEQKSKLEREKKEFSRRIELEDRRLKQQQQLFDMKVKILEEEYVKLASERKSIEKKKEFYNRVNAFERNYYDDYRNDYNQEHVVINGGMFFLGVANKQSVKKRYRDLIKIYHPDNMYGDTDAIQEINNEYNKLCAIYDI